MDGRVQLPLNTYIREQLGSDVYVDTITEPGPERYFIEDAAASKALVAQMLLRVGISLENHGASEVFVSAHDECAGHPDVDRETKIRCVQATIEAIQKKWPSAKTHALYVTHVGHDWIVEAL
jgi:hypothetical protein